MIKFSSNDIPAFIANEINPKPKAITKGNRGKNVLRVQEWLDVHKFHTAIDGDFGPATKSAVQDFQSSKGLRPTGNVNTQTWKALCEPMSNALLEPTEQIEDVAQLVTFFAKKHLEQQPKEIGGSNKGPWVRLYCYGNDGDQWAWCAGFVTLILRQAYFYAEQKPPIQGSVSCDILATQGKNAGLFIKGKNVRSGKTRLSNTDLPLIFLRRRTSTDWTHTGFVIDIKGTGKDTEFITIEGNTNSLGQREGIEACKRRRSLYGQDYDFMRVKGTTS